MSKFPPPLVPRCPGALTKDPDGPSDLESLKRFGSVGARLWMMWPTTKSVARGHHICPPHCKPGASPSGPLEGAPQSELSTLAAPVP